MHSLHDGGNALEAHSGIHGWLRQRCELAVRGALVLHEDEVPDFHIAITVLIGRARCAARNLRAVIVKNLSARTARSGISHGPEVGLRAQSGEALLGDADLLEPDIRGFVIVQVYREPQPRGVELQRARQEIPRKADGIPLEVIPEREVAEHLEECVVARGVAHVLQIVVLAPGAHASLAGGGAHVFPPFFAEEHVLELHHACIGKQQGRVVAGHKRTRRHDRVAARAKEFQKRATDVRRAQVRRFAQVRESGSKSAPSAERI